MEIVLDDVAKKFGTEYILKGVSLTLKPGLRSVVLGPNGSGKSTLMKILSGFLTPTKGCISYNMGEGKSVAPIEVWRYVSFAAPYIELIEEMTMRELVHFQQRARGFIHGMQAADVVGLTELEHALDREIRFFSSGMKQRLKIALALTTKSDFVLLDEPTTNLDEQATAWYLRQAQAYTANRILVIASNDPTDLTLANHRIEISKYK